MLIMADVLKGQYPKGVYIALGSGSADSITLHSSPSTAEPSSLCCAVIKATLCECFSASSGNLVVALPGWRRIYLKNPKEHHSN